MSRSTVLIAGEELARYGFANGHPFGPDRYAAFMASSQRSGLVRASLERAAARVATRAELEWFHTPAYVDLVRERSRARHRLCSMPATRPRCAASSRPRRRRRRRRSVAARAVMAGRARRAFIPIAGLHHAARDHAAGFCVFNDCGVAIEMLRAQPRSEAHRVRRHRRASRRRRVLRIRETIRTCSFADMHEDGRFLYPAPAPRETGRGRPRGTKLNCRCRRAPTTSVSSGVAGGRRLPATPRSPSSSCFSAVRTASKATRSRTCASRRTRTRTRRARLRALADELGHGRVLAMGGGGYNRRTSRGVDAGVSKSSSRS